ncbi:hypothetical protein ACRAWD_11480 [Caulobacter segnis]
MLAWLTPVRPRICNSSRLRAAAVWRARKPGQAGHDGAGQLPARRGRALATSPPRTSAQNKITSAQKEADGADAEKKRQAAGRARGQVRRLYRRGQVRRVRLWSPPSGRQPDLGDRGGRS